jgi:hypothetical protein
MEEGSLPCEPSPSPPRNNVAPSPHPRDSIAPPRDNSPTFCKFQFGVQGWCRLGDKCTYSHDPQVYMKKMGLHMCPNKGCDNMCRGKQCQECHLRHMAAQDEQRNQQFYQEKAARRQEKQARIQARPDRKCAGWNCTKSTKFTFCDQCYEINQRYVI